MDDNFELDVSVSISEDSLEASDEDHIFLHDPLESPEKISCALCVSRNKEEGKQQSAWSVPLPFFQILHRFHAVCFVRPKLDHMYIFDYVFVIVAFLTFLPFDKLLTTILLIYV